MGPEGTKWERNLPPIVVSIFICSMYFIGLLIVDLVMTVERCLCSPSLDIHTSTSTILSNTTNLYNKKEDKCNRLFIINEMERTFAFEN